MGETVEKINNPWDAQVELCDASYDVKIHNNILSLILRVMEDEKSVKVRHTGYYAVIYELLRFINLNTCFAMERLNGVEKYLLDCAEAEFKDEEASEDVIDALDDETVNKIYDLVSGHMNREQAAKMLHRALREVYAKEAE